MNTVARYVQMTRRRLLMTTAVAGVLAGCKGSGGAVAPYVAAIKAVGTEALTVIPELAAAGIALPPQVSDYLTAINRAAGAVGSAATVTEGQSVLVQIEGYVNALAPVLLPLLAAAVPGAGATLGLIVAALPAVEALVNVAVTELTPLAKQLAQYAPTMVTPTGQPVPGAPRATGTVDPNYALAVLIGRVELRNLR